MTREDVKAWQERWQRVNEHQRQELQARSPEEKLVQLAVLMEEARLLKWSEALSAEDEKVWQRWQQLRRAYETRTRAGRASAQ